MSSDAAVGYALGAGFAALALATTLALLIVLLRLELVHSMGRWERFVARWQPELHAVMAGGAPLRLRPRRRAEALLFLRLWSYLQASVRGQARDRLAQAAREIGTDRLARDLLRRGTRAQKLQAAVCCGYLRDAASWEMLRPLAVGTDPLLAVQAAQALFRIDPGRAAGELSPVLLTRRDWDTARLLEVLMEGRDSLQVALARSLEEVDASRLPRALDLVRQVGVRVPEGTLLRLLDPEQPWQVLCAALRLASSPQFADAVRACTRHPHAMVRAEAAAQLHRVASAIDVSLLRRLLHDGDQQVRLGAARSLARLPFLSPQHLKGLAAGAGADTALRQAIAETQW